MHKQGSQESNPYFHDFQPSRPNISIELDAQYRIAHALEYIAAQLRQINQKLATIEASFRKPPPGTL
jgi:hypothetical protein